MDHLPKEAIWYRNNAVLFLVHWMPNYKSAVWGEKIASFIPWKFEICKCFFLFVFKSNPSLWHYLPTAVGANDNFLIF